MALKGQLRPPCGLPYVAHCKKLVRLIELGRRGAPMAGSITTTGCVLRSAILPADPGFTSWSMLFTSTVSHPSVIFRKSAIQAAGGYDESIARAEDYDLWLRIVSKDCTAVRSLPFVGLWHRKHASSSTAGETESVAQRNESIGVSRAAIGKLLEKRSDVLIGGKRGIRDVSATLLAAVPTLRKPDEAPSALSIDEAVTLLEIIEDAFLRTNADRLTHREAILVKKDCDERTGELATVLVRKFGGGPMSCRGDVKSSVAWRTWCRRCPDLHLERMSLLCHCTK